MTNSKNNQTQPQTVFKVNLKLKSKSLRQLEKVKNAIRSIFWEDAWSAYKAEFNVSGKDAATDFWNTVFFPQWETSDYNQCEDINVLASLIAESDMTIEDVLAEAEEIVERKNKLYQKSNEQNGQLNSNVMSNGMRQYPYNNQSFSNEEEEYDPLY